MITLRVKYLTTMRDRVGVDEDEVVLQQGASLRDLVRYLEQKRGLLLPRADIIATLNGKGWEQASQGLDTPLQTGDIVHLFPPIAGG